MRSAGVEQDLDGNQGSDNNGNGKQGKMVLHPKAGKVRKSVRGCSSTIVASYVR